MDKAARRQCHQNSVFLGDLLDELVEAEDAHAPMHSLHEAFAVILEEVDEFWDECRKKSSERDPAHIRRELLQIAAMAWRCALDVLKVD
jgi:hypothetical protein